LCRPALARVRPALAGGPALAVAGPSLVGLTSAAAFFFLQRFQASSLWFFFFLLFHTSMMSDLSMDVVDAHDVVLFESHPVSSPPLQKALSSTFTQHHHVGEIDIGTCTWCSPSGRPCEDWFGNSSMFIHLP
jgi:hypothetical protein